MNKVAISAVALLALSSSGFAATLQSMNKDQVTKLVSDNTITTFPIATVNKEIISNTFTGYFGKDGKTQGKFANTLDPQTDTGTWNVKDDGSLCMVWEHWSSGKEVCATIYELSNGYLFINSDNQFESVITKDVQSGNQVGAASTAPTPATTPTPGPTDTTTPAEPAPATSDE